MNHHSGFGNQQSTAGDQLFRGVQTLTQGSIPIPTPLSSSGSNNSVNNHSHNNHNNVDNNSNSLTRTPSQLPSIGQLSQSGPSSLGAHHHSSWAHPWTGPGDMSQRDDRHHRRFTLVDDGRTPHHPYSSPNSAHERTHSQSSSPQESGQSPFVLPIRNAAQPTQVHGQSSSSSSPPHGQNSWSFPLSFRSPPIEANGYPSSSSTPQLPPILVPVQHPPTPPMNTTPPMNSTPRPGSSSSHMMGYQQASAQYGGHQQPQSPYNAQQHHHHHQQQQQQQSQVQYGGQQPPRASYDYQLPQVPYGHHPPPTPPLAHSSSHVASSNSHLQPAPITPTAQPYPALPTPMAATPQYHHHQQPVYQSQPHAAFASPYDPNLPVGHLPSNNNASDPGSPTHSLDPSDPGRAMFYNTDGGPSCAPGRDHDHDMRQHPQRASGSGMGSLAPRGHYDSSALGPSLRPSHHMMGVGRHHNHNHHHHMLPNHRMGAYGPFGLEAHITGTPYSPFYHSHPPRRGCTVQDRPYRCATCHSAFSRNHDLKRHEKIHLEVKPHACVCERRFSRKDALKVCC
jgi:hypothetical protein